METIFSSKNLEYQYDESKQLLILKSKPATQHRTSEEMRSDVEKNVELVEQYRPLYYINNQIDNRYTYKVEEQKWVAQTLTQVLIKVGLKKLAFIVPKELIVEMSLEQLVQEGGKTPFDVKYFSIEAEAIKWFGF